MKSLQLLVVGALAMLCACQPAQQGNKYTVTGELEDSAHHGKKIYIMRYDDNVYVDSTLIEGNKFVFEGEVDTAAFCRIDVSRNAFANFILEGGDVKVDLKTHVYPSGTPQNDEMSRIAKEEADLYAELDHKMEDVKKQYEGDDAKIDEAIKKQKEEFKATLRKRCEELYAHHNDDAVGFYLVYSMFFDALDVDGKLEISSTFGPWLKSQKMVKEVLVRVNAFKNTAEGMPWRMELCSSQIKLLCLIILKLFSIIYSKITEFLLFSVSVILLHYRLKFFAPCKFFRRLAGKRS